MPGPRLMPYLHPPLYAGSRQSSDLDGPGRLRPTDYESAGAAGKPLQTGALTAWWGSRWGSGSPGVAREVGVEEPCHLRLRAGQQVAVAVVGDLDRAVAHVCGDRLGVRARRDQQRREGVPALVQLERLEPRLRPALLEPLDERRVAPRAGAISAQSGQHQAAGPERFAMVGQHRPEALGDRHDPLGRLRLGGDELLRAVVPGALHPQHPQLEINALPVQREQLAGPQAGVAGERERGAVVAGQGTG